MIRPRPRPILVLHCSTCDFALMEGGPADIADIAVKAWERHMATEHGPAAMFADDRGPGIVGSLPEGFGIGQADLRASVDATFPPGHPLRTMAFLGMNAFGVGDPPPDMPDADLRARDPVPGCMGCMKALAEWYTVETPDPAGPRCPSHGNLRPPMSPKGETP